MKILPILLGCLPLGNPCIHKELTFRIRLMEEQFPGGSGGSWRYGFRGLYFPAPDLSMQNL
jgi:hypothetical protein